MGLTSEIIFRASEEIGVVVVVEEHPNIPAYVEFIITGNPENRKTMIEFIERFRYAGFVFKYIEKDEEK